MITWLLLACADPAAWVAERPYSTVQQAIDDAEPGDTVEVGSGTHFEALHITTRIILRGQDGAVLSGDYRWRIIDAPVAVVIENLTLVDGAAATGSAIRATELTLRNVSISNSRGQGAAVSATGMVHFETVSIAGEWAVGGALLTGDEVWMSDIDIDTVNGRALEVASIGSVELHDVRIDGDPFGSIVLGSEVLLQNVDASSFIGITADKLQATALSAHTVGLSVGSGTVDGLHAQRLSSIGADLRNVVLSGQAPALVLREGSLTVGIVDAQQEPARLSTVNASLHNVLIRDVSEPQGLPLLFAAGDVHLKHVTWMNSTRNRVADRGRIHLEQSILANVSLDRFGIRHLTAQDSYGWGAGLGGRAPWETVQPQLDGVDLAEDSRLIGVGEDGHPGAFGGPEGTALWKLCAENGGQDVRC